MKKVSNGIDNLAHDAKNLEFLRARRCGLVTNHTGIAADNRTTLQVLESLSIRVDVLFSPEHGLAGTREGNIESTVENDRTVFSLYGETRRPTEAMLDNLDVLIFDIADVGARFYTYGSTLALCLEECLPRSIAVVVLDRPNPLGGMRVEGPQIHEELRSFIGHVRLPILHGMTLGEIALLHCANENLSGDLRVVQCSNWRREMTWPQFGKRWIAPSPNLPDYTSAQWYAGACLLEFCDVSVGRGTDAPFQIIGAPWIDARKWSSALANYTPYLANYSWEICGFVPQRATHQDATCHGLRFSCDGEPQNIIALGLALLASLHQSHRTEFGDKELEKTLPLLGSCQILELVRNDDLAAAISLCHSDAARFKTRRQPYLIYE